MVLEVACIYSLAGLVVGMYSQRQFNLVDIPYDEVFDHEWEE